MNDALSINYAGIVGMVGIIQSRPRLSSGHEIFRVFWVWPWVLLPNEKISSQLRCSLELERPTDSLRFLLQSRDESRGCWASRDPRRSRASNSCRRIRERRALKSCVGVLLWSCYRDAQGALCAFSRSRISSWTHICRFSARKRADLGPFSKKFHSVGARPDTSKLHRTSDTGQAQESCALNLSCLGSTELFSIKIGHDDSF